MTPEPWIDVNCICCLEELGAALNYDAATHLAIQHFPDCPAPNAFAPYAIQIGQEGDVIMPEIPINELFGYRSHRHLPDLHSYHNLRADIGQNGVKVPIDIVTDGIHCYIEDGHQRLHAAVENGLKSLPVKVIQKTISARRRIKYELGPELRKLMTPTPEPVEPSPAES